MERYAAGKLAPAGLCLSRIDLADDWESMFG